MPFFKDIVFKCFVRIGIGSHEGRSVYRVSSKMQIISFTKHVVNSGNSQLRPPVGLPH